MNRQPKVYRNALYKTLQAEAEFYNYHSTKEIDDFILHGIHENNDSDALQDYLKSVVAIVYSQSTTARYKERVKKYQLTAPYSDCNLFFNEARNMYSELNQQKDVSLVELWQFYDVLEKWLATFTSQFTTFMTHRVHTDGTILFYVAVDEPQPKQYHFILSYPGLADFYRFLRAKMLTKHDSSYFMLEAQTIMGDYQREAAQAGGCSLIADTKNNRYETLFVSDNAVQYKCYKFDLENLYELASVIHNRIAVPELNNPTKGYQRSMLNHALCAIVNHQQIMLDQQSDN